MRPIAVLALLLGALASLFFAFVMISGSSRSQTEGTRVTRNPVVRPNRPLIEEPELEQLQVTPVSATRLSKSLEPVIARGQVTGGGAHIGFINGRVVDPAGEPVPKAKISLIRLSDGALWSGAGLSLTGDPASSKALAKAVSDEKGEFHFGGIEPGDNWGLSVRHPDFAQQINGPILVPDRGGKEELIELEIGDVLMGIVVDAELEAPIANALLTLVNPMAAFLPSTRKSKGEESVRSDAEGKFRFANINGAQRTLIITAEGFATQVLANFTGVGSDSGAWGEEPADGDGAQERRPQTIRLSRGQNISGIVLAPDRSGVPGVKLTAVNQIGRFGSRSEATSNADGSFVLKDLGPGAFSITTEAENFQTVGKQNVQVGSTNVEIQLVEFGSVSGLVTDAESGAPLENFSCRVRSEHPNNPSWGVVVKRGNFRDRSKGDFLLEGVREGRYVVEVESQGFASSFSAPFRVQQGIETPDISIAVSRGSVISGLVVDASTGAPLAGAQVSSNDNNFIDTEFMKFLGGMSDSATSKRSVSTDDDGSFRLELMTPDIYQVRVWKEGYTTIVLNDVNVRSVNKKTLPTFRLPRGATITGNVYDEEGQGVPGASVILSPDDPALYSDQLQVRADAKGAFSFKFVKQGSYKLQATRPQRPGANPFAGAVDMQNSRVEVQVTEGQSHSYDIRFKSQDNSKQGGF